MRRLLSAAVLGLAVSAVPLSTCLAQPAPATQPAAKAAGVPVKAVVLFSSGVGYFEHFGSVDGDSDAELRFKTNQINDILKSLVLEDTGGGKVGVITYPSQDPLAKTLRSFQIDITSNPGLGELLNQLRGARVRISLGADKLEGTILGLEKKPKPSPKDTAPVQVWQLNLVSGGIIRSVELDQVSQLELEDKGLQDELNKALVALAEARVQDTKPVSIHFQGKGRRQVRLGYVVETPVWKTSYRLLMSDPKGQGAKAADRLQGWAIVENQTDNDWDAVELSLVSGRPISFIQDLYQPLYVPRPLVQPQLYASLRPQTYEGGMEKAKDVQAFAEQSTLAPMGRPGAVQLRARKSAALADRDAAENERGEGAAAYDGTSAAADKPRGPMNAGASIASLASASKMGELFQYTVGSVSLPRQRSAMIPIITDPVEVERLSIYNQSVLARNPLNGARVKNTTGKHLLAGPVTVLDNGSYAGDASIDNLPPGQERLVSYGVDLQLLVDATKNTNTATIETGKIVKGVLFVSRRNVFTQEYAAQNKGDNDKTLIVEHPIRQGWKLVEGAPYFVKPYETTEALYRFRGHVAAGKATTLTVREQVVNWESVAILPSDAEQLDWYVRNTPINAAVKEALGHAIQLKGVLTDTQRQYSETQQKVAAITAEQGRIRENMKTVDKSSPYYNRLLSKLNDQEGQFEKLNDELDGLKKKMEGQRKEFEDYLSNLNVDENATPAKKG